jgi:hypothetical protein
MGSPKGCEPQGDGVLIVVVGVTAHQGERESLLQGEGAQVSRWKGTARYARCEMPKRYLTSTNGSLESHVIRKAVKRGLEGGRWKSALDWQLAGGLPYRTHGSEGGMVQ